MAPTNNSTAQASSDSQALALYNMPSVAKDLPSEYENVASAMSGNIDDIGQYLSSQHPDKHFFKFNNNIYETTPNIGSQLKASGGADDMKSDAISKGFAYRIDPGMVASLASGILPTALSVVGAGLGAGVGLAGGPSALAGGMIGAGTGNVVGNTANQFFAKQMGVPTNMDTPATLNPQFAPFDSKQTTYNRLMPININVPMAKQFATGAVLQGAGELAGLLGKTVPGIPETLGNINGEEIPSGFTPSSNLTTQIGDILKSSKYNMPLGDSNINVSEIAKEPKGPAATDFHNAQIKNVQNIASDMDEASMQHLFDNIGKSVENGELTPEENESLKEMTQLRTMMLKGANNPSDIPINYLLKLDYPKLQNFADKVLKPNVSDDVTSTITNMLSNLGDFKAQVENIQQEIKRGKDISNMGNIASRYAEAKNPLEQSYPQRLNYQFTGPQMGATLMGQAGVRPLTNIPALNLNYDTSNKNAANNIATKIKENLRGK